MVATTSRPDLVDAALLRPGRLEKVNGNKLVNINILYIYYIYFLYIFIIYYVYILYILSNG